MFIFGIMLLDLGGAGRFCVHCVCDYMFHFSMALVFMFFLVAVTSPRAASSGITARVLLVLVLRCRLF